MSTGPWTMGALSNTEMAEALTSPGDQEVP